MAIYKTNDYAAVTALFDFLQRQLALPRTFDVDRYPLDGGEPWSAALRRIGDEHGLRMNETSLTVAEMADASGPMMPWLTQLRDGPAGARWLVVSGSHGGRLNAALITAEGIREDRMALAQIAALIGIDEASPLRWLCVEAKAPLAAAVNDGTHGHHMPPLRRLLELLHPERRDLWLVIAFSFGIGMLGLATPVAVQALVNTVAMGGVLQPVMVLAVMLFLFLALSGAIYVMQSFLVEIVQRRIFVRVAADLAYRLPRVRCEIYDRNHGAELVNRFFDVLTVQKAGATLLLEGVATVLQAGIGLLVLAFYHPFLLAFDVILLAAIAFVILGLGRKAVPTAIAESISKYALVAWLEEIARHLITFKSHGGPDLALERTDHLAHAYLDARRSHFRIVLRQIVGAVALQALAGTALLAIGGVLVVEGQLTVGQLVAAELIVSAVLASFAKFGKQLESFYDLLAGVDKLGHLIDLPLEREDGGRFEAPVYTPATLAVLGVDFSYERGTRVFQGLSFSARAGERLAILAAHGAGKSTLGDLILGLRAPTGGRIEFNGIDIRDIRLEALREKIAVVGRIEIIEDSIIENIRAGRVGISPDDIRRTLTAVGLADELSNQPDSLRTELGPNGAPLSTGQTRRIMLARALVGKPALLVVDGILDELDEESREVVWSALTAADVPWTLLVLTQSPHIAALCQRTMDLTQAESGAPGRGLV